MILLKNATESRTRDGTDVASCTLKRLIDGGNAGSSGERETDAHLG